MVTDSEREGFASRLNRLLDELDFPSSKTGRQKALGKMFGVSGNGARKWLTGESMPSMARLACMSKELGARAEWLLTGHGPMWTHEATSTRYGQEAASALDETPVHEPIGNKPIITRSPDESSLLRKYRILIEADKRRVQKILDAFGAEQNNADVA